jgi:hypothetical protein
MGVPFRREEHAAQGGQYCVGRPPRGACKELLIQLMRDQERPWIPSPFPVSDLGDTTKRTMS